MRPREEHHIAQQNEVIPVNLNGTEIPAITDRIKGHLNDIQQGFYRLAEDLTELKDEFKQLKPTERKALGNLDGYCRMHFGFGKAYANYQIAAKVAHDNLKSTTGVAVFPAIEKPVRPLTKFNKDPEKQAKVWNKAVDLAGGNQPTEDDVKNAIKKHEEPQSSKQKEGGEEPQR